MIHFLGHEVLMLRLRNNLGRPGFALMKRALDFAVATILLAILAPFFVLAMALIKASGGEIFYAHPRIGRAGRPFLCYKFRTMVADADRVLSDILSTDASAKEEWEHTFKLKNDPRVTKFGAFLRKTSLDELPQLWNVLRGDMSLVGPRPIVQSEIERYGDMAEYYFMVRPGITGLWQASGRTSVDYSTRVALDVWYVRNWSPWYDVVILLKTVKAVIGMHGAY
jgi:Undecaprenyl-phosphate galactose phosphotransferase WbaP